MGITIFRPGRRVVIPAPGVQVWAPGVASAAFTGVLDGISNVAAAYSLRKLRSAYAGSAVRVRRSSDSTEQDIGFDGSGEFDSSAFSSFVSGGTGYVKTWYDQSGNSRDATQTTTANQPHIVTGSLPYLRYDDNVDRKLSATFSLSTGNVVWTEIIKYDTLSGLRYGSFLSTTSTAYGRVWRQFSSNPNIYQGGLDPALTTSAAFSTALTIETWEMWTTWRYRRNGALISSGTDTNKNISGLAIGNADYAPVGANRYEVILLSATISTTDHNTIGSNMATRYGLSWTTVT